MNIDMFGSYNPAPNVMGTRSKACLFLFTPRRIPDTAQRSFAFNFSQGAIDNMIESSLQQTLTKPSTVSSFLAENVIVPSTTTRKLRTSTFSENWTFTAIIEDRRPELYNTSLQPSKIVVTGMCSEEPVHPGSIHNTDPITNPRCMLTPLNAIEIMTVPDGYGGTSVQERVVSHFDIPRYLNEIASSFSTAPVMPLYRTNPSDCVLSTLNDSHQVNTHSGFDHYDYSKLDNSDNLTIDYDSAQVNHTEMIRAKSNEPAEQLRNLFIPIHNSVTIDSNGYGMDPLYIASNIHNGIISTNKTIGNHLASNIFVNGELSLDMFKSRFSPTLQIIQTPAVTDYNSMAVDVISPVSTYSHLISQVLPSYLYDAGLSGISFTYDSWTDEVQFHHCETLSPMSSHMQTQRTKAMMLRLKSEVFPVMNFMGAFSLSVLVNMNHQTICHLDFYDLEHKFDIPYVTENIFKGYSDLTFGDRNDFISNTTEIGSVINNVSAGLSIRS